MAKISARGHRAVARAHREDTDSDRWHHRHTLVLRSDGAILAKGQIRRPGDTRWGGGHYSIVARIRRDAPTDPVAIFERFVTRRGYTVAP